MKRSLSFVRQRILGRVVVMAMFLAASASGASYYVATTGNDGADGSSGAPFKTIQKAAGVAKAGDIVYVHAGVYRETVTPANSGSDGSPIIFCAFGSDSVVVSGADPVPGPWTLSSGKIYVTDIALEGKYNTGMTTDTTLLANQVFVNGEMMPQCRWPNLAGTNAVNPNFNQGSPWPTVTGGLTGAIAWESCWYITRTGVVQNADASSITWVGNGSNQADIRHIVTGVLGLLDAEREWHYDFAAKKLYFWAPGGGVPANVEAKARNFAFDLRGKSYITVKRVNVFASTIITDAASAHTTIDHITARYVSHYVVNQSSVGSTTNFAAHEKDSGIMLYGPFSMILNSKVLGSAGVGIMTAGHHNIIYNCLVVDCDYQGNYADPVLLLDDTVQVLHNTISGGGRDGMGWDWHNAAGGNGGKFYASELAYNDISNYARLENDVGSIYVCCAIDMTGTSVHHTNTHDMSGVAPGPYGVGAGVYLDNSTFGWCAYQNIGNPGGENHNGNGGPGTCPAGITQSWPIPAGCNMPGCGGAVGKTLLKYPGVPDSVTVPAPITASRQAIARGRIFGALADDARISVYAVNGSLIASMGTADMRIASQSGIFADGTYCIRVDAKGGTRTCRLVVSRGIASAPGLTQGAL